MTQSQPFATLKVLKRGWLAVELHHLLLPWILSEMHECQEATFISLIGMRKQEGNN
jgi:hypothetical protein